MVVEVVEQGQRRGGLSAAALGGTVFLAGGHNGETPVKLFEAFQPGESLDARGRWKRLEPMLARRTYSSSVVYEGKVYVIGGSADGRVSNTFEVFDAETGEWSDWYTLPPMLVKRTLHQACICKGRIFVCGGFDGVRDLNSLEEFDVASNGWKWRNPMERGRSYFALACVDHSIFAVGGQDRGKDDGSRRAQAFVDRFDLYSERWFSVAPLLEGRVGCAAAALAVAGKEYLFVCGGSNSENTLTSVERYDPQEDKWEEVAPMGQKRSAHAVAVVNGRFYAIGGFDGKEPLGTFECYDPVENRWGPLTYMGASDGEDASARTSVC